MHWLLNWSQYKLSSRDTAMRGLVLNRGHFLETVSYIPNVKEPAMNGHLSCRDTLSQIKRQIPESQFHCICDPQLHQHCMRT